MTLIVSPSDSSYFTSLYGDLIIFLFLSNTKQSFKKINIQYIKKYIVTLLKDNGSYLLKMEVLYKWMNAIIILHSTKYKTGKKCSIQ